jgi:hypothetical protein
MHSFDSAARAFRMKLEMRKLDNSVLLSTGQGSVFLYSFIMFKIEVGNQVH